MNAFQKKFFNLISEAPETMQPDPTTPVSDDPAAEMDAAASQLDPATDVATLGAPDNPESALKQQQTARKIQTLTTWIGEVEGFIDYLNGTDEGSINFAIKKFLTLR